MNNYDKEMKKHKGPLSFSSNLESIEDIEYSEKESSAHNGKIERSCMASGTLSSKAILSRASNFSINDILGDSSKKGQNSEKSVAKDPLQN